MERGLERQKSLVDRFYNRDDPNDRPVTRGDLIAMQKERDRIRRSRLASAKRSRMLGKAVRATRRGLIGTKESLATPQSDRRPRIAQLPARKRDIPIVSLRKTKDRESLKHPGLRGQSIMWRPGGRTI